MKTKLFNNLLDFIEAGNFNLEPDYDYNDLVTHVQTNFGAYHLEFSVEYHLETATSYGDDYLTQTCDYLVGVEPTDILEPCVYINNEGQDLTEEQENELKQTILNRLS